VPLVLVSNDAKVNLRTDGSLRDISPTLLGVLGLDEPIEMTGRDLRIPRA
jgi:2,3-bisphosphoglycerate-independent phosphoglycerate mutase